MTTGRPLIPEYPCARCGKKVDVTMSVSQPGGKRKCRMCLP